MSDKNDGRASLPHPVSEQIGRLFNLLYNRVSMYSLEHPTTRECLAELLDAVQKGLDHLSPLAVILDKDRLYVEEEALDPRTNPHRLVAHMKKAGVESVSFERGVALRDLVLFAKVFSDTKQYPDAESMKRALLKGEVRKVRINHVFFKKVTKDEEIVDRDSVSPVSGLSMGQVVIDDSRTSERSHQEALNPGAVSAGVSDGPHLGMGISLFQMEPSQVLREIMAGVQKEEKSAQNRQHLHTDPIIGSLRQMRERIQRKEGGEAASDPSRLLKWVFGFREGLMNEIRQGKQKGELSIDEEQVLREMDELTDSVFIEVIKEEYKKGQISPKRMAQIIRRMMPDPRDLKRILPKLKEALLAEGMSLKDYLELIQNLEKELRNEELTILFEEGAEAIGLTVEELIREVRKGPKAAAELIVMAAELRAVGEQQQDLLKELLVDYLEKACGELALTELETSQEKGQEALLEILHRIREELMEPLRARIYKKELLKEVEEETRKRTERNLETLQREWILMRILSQSHDPMEAKRALDLLDKVYEDPAKKSEAYKWIVQAISNRGVEVRGVVEAGEVKEEKVVHIGVEEADRPPQGTVNRPIMLFLLREELKRAKRFTYCFSLIELAVAKAVALRPIPIGFIQPFQVRNGIMEEVASLVRDVDLIGILGERKVLILMPFADEGEVSILMDELRALLRKKKSHQIRGVPMEVEVKMASHVCKGEEENVQGLLIKLEKKLEIHSAAHKNPS
jgi:hypothetical protein